MTDDRWRYPVTIADELLAEATRAIQVARARFPNLGTEGFYPVRTLTDGVRHFDVTRDCPDVSCVATALAFLRQQCIKIKTPTVGSYTLKHYAEKWGEQQRMTPYVSNGDLLVAAVYLDFPIRRANNPNADVGVSRKTLPDTRGPWIRWARR